jgi:chromosome segregation ATPase
MDTRLLARRIATAAGVIAVLAIGLGSIRAASAWTAASAPLTVAPVTISSLEADLAQERARSDALRTQLLELDTRSRELETALVQARERIGSDTVHAGELEDQLKDATGKLEKLEKAIAKAKRDLAARVAAAKAASAAQASTSNSTHHDDDDDDEHEDEDDDEDEHEDDDDDD